MTAECGINETALFVIGSILLFALPGDGLGSKRGRAGNQSPRKS